MNNYVSLKAEPPFQSGQIICLEHQDTCLYGEVIQIVPQRKQCWFRPRFLVIYSSNSEWASNGLQLINLVNSSDLLLPVCLFRASWDTEVIPLLSQLDDNERSFVEESISRQHLHQFIYQVWQTQKDKF